MTRSSDEKLPAIAAPHLIDADEFWEATKEDKFLLQKCGSCGCTIWFPRRICPECQSFDISSYEASGKGTIYTFSVTWRAQGPWAACSPYVLAYIELEEGPRVMTNIVECEVEDLKIGDPVEVVFAETDQGIKVPRFRPV